MNSHSSAGRPLAGLFARRLGGATLFLAVWMVVSLLTRIALFLQAFHSIPLKFSVLGAFVVGFVYDLAAGLLWSAPLALLSAAIPSGLFRRRFAAPVVHGLFFVVLYVLLFVGVAEWFFWDEFGARFNFIAVDYLVYTQEVVGNIRESYPMPLIFACLAAAAGLGLFGLSRAGWIGSWLAHPEEAAGPRWLRAGAWTACAACAALLLSEDLIPSWKNNYERELAKNGPWSFVAAFRGNRLDYEQFYATLPVESAFARVKARVGREGWTPPPGAAADGLDLARTVPAPRPGDPELRPNIVQITVESLSGEFLARYGGRNGWTPNLDALCARALVFDRFYATGNRTDRGMEALTLAVPPTPGRSLVKRPENAGLFTLGSVLRGRGYDTAFIYGGYGYFDNMNAFFGGNGYRVVDRNVFAPGEITFANAWGACDEDLFNRALKEADAQHAAGRPFFQFLMTTSNHRPFTFPAGRIDLPSGSAKRGGGVKYTDYAIGRFLREAESRPWFKDTVFVIVADHCASSAGRAELEVHNYHIPLIIYAPGGQVAPGVVKGLCSQVDYAPTLLALLNWSYPSRFFGENALVGDGPGRALVGNYQKLGLFTGDRLALLAPVRRRSVFSYDPGRRALTPIRPDSAPLDDAIAYYQTASWLIKNGRQGAWSNEAAATAPVRASAGGMSSPGR